ncbi:hypothetical protein B0H16DRAFT_1475308 [Mycena metata]|uniref:Uncharacterized protein n=1 Tax=Mycena metata TaxID=1033252 RepID=A0AAD7HFD9_9AGAR|nr:hypothetical protein B0H16DRAFT_1475308 [Mycena metata]
MIGGKSGKGQTPAKARRASEESTMLRDSHETACPSSAPFLGRTKARSLALLARLSGVAGGKVELQIRMALCRATQRSLGAWWAESKGRPVCAKIYGRDVAASRLLGGGGDVPSAKWEVGTEKAAGTRICALTVGGEAPETARTMSSVWGNRTGEHEKKGERRVGRKGDSAVRKCAPATVRRKKNVGAWKQDSPESPSDEPPSIHLDCVFVCTSLPSQLPMPFELAPSHLNTDSLAFHYVFSVLISAKRNATG